MNTFSQVPCSVPPEILRQAHYAWFAIQTRSKHEKKIASHLSYKCIDAFVPAVREVHRWSDRLKSVEMPLFPCYVFIHVIEWREIYQSILRTPGVLHWVTVNGKPALIPDSEIEYVQRMLNAGVEVTSYPFLKVGRRVRIRGGCLEGVEGTLVKKNKDSKLFVSITLIQRSMSIPLEGYDIEAVS